MQEGYVLYFLLEKEVWGCGLIGGVVFGCVTFLHTFGR
jgi:hypothetical protein